VTARAAPRPPSESDTQRWRESSPSSVSVHTAKSNETYSALSLDALHLRLSRVGAAALVGVMERTAGAHRGATWRRRSTGRPGSFGASSAAGHVCSAAQRGAARLGSSSLGVYIGAASAPPPPPPLRDRVECAGRARRRTCYGATERTPGPRVPDLQTDRPTGRRACSADSPVYYDIYAYIYIT